MHIPDPRRHAIRYYGAYSSVARARHRREAASTVAVPAAAPVTSAPANPEMRALRRRWAQLIHHIFEVDPLVCQRCGARMRILASITEPRVITKILRHLATQAPDQRSPPQTSPAAA